MEKAIERKNYRAGGLVTGPGTSTSDSVPAVIPEGAFVLNAAAVEFFTPAMLDVLNSAGARMGEVSLSAGEFVFRPETVAAIGQAFFWEINQLGLEIAAGTATEEGKLKAFAMMLSLTGDIGRQFGLGSLFVDGRGIGFYESPKAAEVGSTSSQDIKE